MGNPRESQRNKVESWLNGVGRLRSLDFLVPGINKFFLFMLFSLLFATKIFWTETLSVLWKRELRRTPQYSMLGLGLAQSRCSINMCQSMQGGPLSSHRGPGDNLNQVASERSWSWPGSTSTWSLFCAPLLSVSLHLLGLKRTWLASVPDHYHLRLLPCKCSDSAGSNEPWSSDCHRKFCFLPISFAEWGFLL